MLGRSRSGCQHRKQHTEFLWDETKDWWKTFSTMEKHCHIFTKAKVSFRMDNNLQFPKNIKGSPMFVCFWWGGLSFNFYILYLNVLFCQCVVLYFVKHQILGSCVSIFFYWNTTIYFWWFIMLYIFIWQHKDCFQHFIVKISIFKCNEKCFWNEDKHV